MMGASLILNYGLHDMGVLKL